MPVIPSGLYASGGGCGNGSETYPEKCCSAPMPIPYTPATGWEESALYAAGNKRLALGLAIGQFGMRTVGSRASFRRPVNRVRGHRVYCCMRTTMALDTLRAEKRVRALTELDDIDALVRGHRARLLRFVTFSVGEDDAAASIVQDCFVKAYAGREKFRGDCSVATWLTSIALNLVRDHQRTRKLQFWRKAAKTAIDAMDMASVLPGKESSPERQLLAREKAQAVAGVVETLSAKQRAVFLMRFSEEMELAEIAKATGMPINTVKTHLHRAVRAVRERLGESK